MSSASDVEAFLFRAVTANARIDDLVEQGQLVDNSGHSSVDGTLLDDFSFAIRQDARRMARVYELLFCFENSVRELIESRLKEVFGVEKWWSDGVPEEVRRSAERLQGREKQTPWHGPRGGTLLAYVDFPVLADIVTERWEHFEDLLGRADWVSNLFNETNLARRAIAHTGVLRQHDIDRMELRVRDWLRVVG